MSLNGPLFLKSFVGASVLVFLGVAAGTWLSYEKSERGDEVARIERSHSANDELARALDGFRQVVAEIKRQTASASIDAGGPAIWLAEYELGPTSVGSAIQILRDKRLAKESATLVGSGSEVLETRLQRESEDFLSNRKTREAIAANEVVGTSFLFDSERGVEWLLLAFPLEAKRAVVALVNPAQALGYFSLWERNKIQSDFRSYLVTVKGRVLAHNLSSYVSADFSNAPIFRDAIQGMLAGAKSGDGGSGEFEAFDHSLVTASYARIRGMPLAIVVEKISSPIVGEPLDFIKNHWIAGQLFGKALIVLGGLLVSTLIFSIGFTVAGRRAWVVAPKPIEKEISKILEAKTELASEIESRNQAADFLKKSDDSHIPSDSLRLESSARDAVFVDQSIAGASLGLGDTPSRHNESIRGSELKHELERQMAIPARDLERDRKLGETFERIAASQSPERMVQLLTESVHRILKRPAIFFCHRPQAKAASAQFCYGLPLQFEELAKKNLSFNVGDETLRRIRDAHAAGKLVNLSGYHPLSRAMMLQLKMPMVPEFDGWPLLAGGSVLGFLIVMRPIDDDQAELERGDGEILGQLLQLTSAGCERLFKDRQRLKSPEPTAEAAARV